MAVIPPNISSLTAQTIWAPIRNEHPIDGVVNLSTTTVTLAVIADGTNPTNDDFEAATWESTTKTIKGKAYYLAYRIIGPLAEGAYKVFAKIVGGTGTPVIEVGPLHVNDDGEGDADGECRFRRWASLSGSSRCPRTRVCSFLVLPAPPGSA